ncbi:MAG: hypothetical protein ACRDHZ_07765 [Ktedonobacteraceae bacterium]
MPFRTVKKSTLVATGFSAPAQASSFYGFDGKTDENNHIHLGVSTQANGQVAPDGEVLVTYISIKMDGYTAGRLEPGSDGRFWLDQLQLRLPGGPTNWPAGYKDKLGEALGSIVNL